MTAPEPGNRPRPGPQQWETITLPRPRAGAHIFGGMLVGAAIILAFFSFTSSQFGCQFAIAIVLLLVGLILTAHRRRTTITVPRADGELQWLEMTLHDFEARILAGNGEQSVLSMHAEYQARAAELRQPMNRPMAPAPAEPAPAAEPAAGDGGATAPTPAGWETGATAPTPAGWETGATSPAAEAPQPESIIPEPIAASVAAPPAEPVAAPASAERRGDATAPTPAAPTRREGPVFSWRAFVTEQSRAMMFYLGGFLAIIATLISLVTGASDAITTPLIGAIYLGSGGLGLALRRSAPLRTVGRVYLGLFALMTPLLALGAYILLLRGTIAVALMICLASLYTGVVYLALCAETSFAPYAYLGWTALAAGLVAVAPWLGAGPQWLALGLGLVALAVWLMYWQMVLDGLLRWRIPFFRDANGSIVLAAGHLSALAGALAVLATEALGLLALTDFLGTPISPAAFTLAALLLLPLAAAWRFSLRVWLKRAWVSDLMEGLAAAFAAQAVVGVAFWAGADRQAMAIVLAGTALAECGGALLLRRLGAGRRALRYGLFALALALAGVGAGIVVFNAAPNWPLVVALGALTLIASAIALTETRWFLLVAGPCLTLACWTLVAALRPDQLPGNGPLVVLALTLALGLLALALSVAARSRRFALPLYLVALADALASGLLLLVTPHSAGYQAGVLLALAAAAYLVALRERRVLPGGLLAGGFGAAAALPFSLNDSSGLDGVYLALGFALAAFVARRLLGRRWSAPLVLLSLWALALAVVHSYQSGVSIPDWQTATHLPFQAWLLLFFALLSYGGARRERNRPGTVVAAALAFAAIVLTPDPLAEVQLVFALGALGAGARMWWGKGWGVAWQGTALLASLLVTARLGTLPDGATAQTLFLLALAITSYLSAVLERQAQLTFISLAYGVAAAWFLPSDDLPRRFLLTAVLAGAAALVGLLLRLPLLRRKVNAQWAFIPFMSALIYSGFALVRAFQASVPWGSGPVLGFAAGTLLIAVVEQAPGGRFDYWPGVVNAVERNPLATTLTGAYILSAALLLPFDESGVVLGMGLTALVGALGLILPRLAQLRHLRKYGEGYWRARRTIPAYTTLLGCSLVTLGQGYQLHLQWLAAAALGCAALLSLVAALRRHPQATALAACYGLLAAYLLPDRDAALQFILTVALTALAAMIGAALRRPPLRARLRPVWCWSPYSVAFGASLLAGWRGVLAAPGWLVVVLLAFGVVAYLLALLEREPALSVLAVGYGLGAAWFVPAGARQVGLLLALAFALAALGALVRLPPLRARLRRQWAWAPYVVAAGASLVALYRLGFIQPGQSEALLLVCAVAAYLLAALEREPAAGIVPALYAGAAVLLQPDARALLPLAIALAVLALIVGRVLGIRWSWPLYAVATLAGLMAGVLGRGDTGFEAITLLALALLAYLIAAIESRPDLLPVALVLGALALVLGVGALGWPSWQTTLAAVGLSLLVTLGQFLWAWLPWLRAPAAPANAPGARLSPRQLFVRLSRPSPRRGLPGAARSGEFIRRTGGGATSVAGAGPLGVWAHRVGGLLLAVGTVGAGQALPDMFAVRQSQTLAEATALLAVGALLALLAWQTKRRLPLYLAGEFAMLALTWGVRWLGAANPLAFVVAPGSYQFVIGALLPADAHVRHGERWGQLASLLGALLLVAPTAYLAWPGISDQTTSLIYAGVLGLEALLMIALGLGTRSRLLALTGGGLVGVAALSGAGLAILYGGKSFIPLIFVVLAALLIGGATWLSLRGRHGSVEA